MKYIQEYGKYIGYDDSIGLKVLLDQYDKLATFDSIPTDISMYNIKPIYDILDNETFYITSKLINRIKTTKGSIIEPIVAEHGDNIFSYIYKKKPTLKNSNISNTIALYRAIRKIKLSNVKNSNISKTISIIIERVISNYKICMEDAHLKKINSKVDDNVRPLNYTIEILSSDYAETNIFSIPVPLTVKIVSSSYHNYILIDAVANSKYIEYIIFPKPLLSQSLTLSLNLIHCFNYKSIKRILKNKNSINQLVKLNYKLLCPVFKDNV